MRTRHKPRACFTLTLLLIGVGLAPAGTKTWDGSSGQSWDVSANWSPSGVPGSADDAFIQLDSAFVRVTSTHEPHVESLTISNRAWMEIEAQNVTVDSVLTLDETTSSSVKLFVRDTPPCGLFCAEDDLLAEYLVLRNGAELILDDCDIRVTENLAINSGSVVSGFGLITVGNGTGSALSNSGLIFPSGGALALYSSVGSIDLDGASQNGDVEVTLGTSSLVVNAPLNDAFDGTITIGDGNVATFGRGWSLGSQGQLYLTGGAAGPAQLNGNSSVTSVADIHGHVDVSSVATIGADVTFRSTADVAVGAGGRMELDGDTVFRGGSFTGIGEIQQDGPAVVAAPTTLSVAFYDMDGAAETTTVSLDPGATLTVNSTQIDSVNNTFNGTLNVLDAATLTVNTPGVWTMAGTLNIGSSGATMFTAVAGQDFSLTGTTNVAGPAEIAAKTTLIGPVVTADAASRVRFGGGKSHVLQGSVINGPGSLDVAAGSSLSGAGTITAAIDAESGSQILAKNGTLNVNGPIVGAGILGTADNTGTLNVGNAWTGIGVDEVVLNGGVLTGTRITNSTVVHGWGTISSSELYNEGVLRAEPGQTLTIASPYLYYNGVSQSGLIETNGGTVHFQNHAGPVGIGGTVSIDGGELRVDKTGGLRVISGATIDFATAGGVLNSTASGGEFVLHAGASLNTAGPGEIHSDLIRFHNGSFTTLDAPLRLFGSSSIDALAHVMGTSRLEIAPGALLASPATLGVGLLNEGIVWPGYLRGTLGVDDYEQDSAGLLRVEIAGLTPGVNHDVLLVAGTATLDGTLDVELVLGFTPSAGDVFRVLEYSAVSGQFANIQDSVFGTGAGQFLQPVYLADHMSLYAPIPGDANFDGMVSGADYTLWADNFNMGAKWGEGDFSGDGQVTGADYTVWADHFGQSVSLDPPAAEPPFTAVPEPSTTLLVFAAGVIAVIAQARRRSVATPRRGRLG